jgi:HK97 family phage major capsid protein
MPAITAADQKTKRLASKHDAVQDLKAMTDQAENLVQQAEELYKLAEEEQRELTSEEEDQIADYLAEADQLRIQMVDQTEERRRASIRAAIDLGRERQAATPDPQQLLNSGRLRYVSHIAPRWQDDPNRGFAHMGEFCAAVFNSGLPNGILDERIVNIRKESAATGMSQGVGSDGGILVPPEFRSQIWEGMQAGIDNLLALTDQYTITGESLTLPATAETSRAHGSRYGGIRGYWLAEAQQKTPSYPRLRQMKLEPQELAVLVYVTDKLLRNAPALEQFVRRAASEEIQFLVNDSIINGSGVGQPLGILNSGGLVTVAKEQAQPADTVVLENINKMYARMHKNPRAGAVWFVNQEVEAQLESLTAVAGTGGFAVYLPQGTGGPTITEAPNARLKGRPVMPIEYCAPLGDLGDIIFANLGYYATGLQGAMREDMSIHIRFDFNETAFRFLFSLDGQPWMNTPVVPYKGSDSLGAFVALAARN